MPQILEKTGKLDILHANAGIYIGGDLVDANTDAIRVGAFIGLSIGH
jgi:ribitol 2-dehydrogenase